MGEADAVFAFMLRTTGSQALLVSQEHASKLSEKYS